MPREIKDENLKEAYCKVLACTGIGAAENNCDELFSQIVYEVVPESMHADYPERLLGCANEVCTDEPYGWRVTQREPSIDDNTTFENLYNIWFKDIIWPA